MNNILHFEPLTTALFAAYIRVGTQAYNEHYWHLWPKQDSSPYIETSFTKKVLTRELSDLNALHFIIRTGKKPIGVIKITLGSAIKDYSLQETLYINKIYILNEFTGKGIGKKVIQFITLRAKALHKKVLWLYTMQKGPALQFYLKNGFSIHEEKIIPFENVIPTEKKMYLMIKEIEP